MSKSGWAGLISNFVLSSVAILSCVLRGRMRTGAGGKRMVVSWSRGGVGFLIKGQIMRVRWWFW